MLEDIASKIRKIIAKADSTSHPEEAATYLEKAHQMMQDHGLELLDLGRLDSDDPVDVDYKFYRGHTIDGWRQLVAPNLAAYLGCRYVESHDGQNRWHSIAGRLSARVTYRLMWPYVDRRVMQMAREDVERGIYRSVNIARRQIGGALAVRISRMVSAREQAAESLPAPALSSANALVPVDIIHAALKQKFPLMAPMKDKTVKANQNARDRAAEVNLNTQVGGRRAPVARIGSC